MQECFPKHSQVEEERMKTNKLKKTTCIVIDTSPLKGIGASENCK